MVNRCEIFRVNRGEFLEANRTRIELSGVIWPDLRMSMWPLDCS